MNENVASLLPINYCACMCKLIKVWAMYFHFIMLSLMVKMVIITDI